MKPVIALVGRPNVGKSTLFNVLTRTRDAIVSNFEGLTRDRQYGKGVIGERGYLVIDTGGLSGDEKGIDGEMANQSMLAIEESDMVFFMVDAKSGVTAMDSAIARNLRQSGKATMLVMNKSDGIDSDLAATDFYTLGLGEPYPIAAVHNRGVHSLMEDVLLTFPEEDENQDEKDESIRVAIVGRPNVGKSTLVNRIMGEERVVVFDLPGTTRDSIYIPFERDGTPYTLIDTAGVRRRARVNETVEKFSVIKTLQAIEDANVVVMVLDAKEGISEQDAHILGFILESGRSLVVVINKWDGLDADHKAKVKHELDVKLPFIKFAKIHTISALHGTGVGDIYNSIKQAYRSAMKQLATPMLTNMLESLIFAHQPPLVGGRRIKLRYAHQGGKNPPIVVIHGNKTDQVPSSYRRYLENAFIEKLNLIGTPVRVVFKGGENPYADKKNKLSEGQIRSKKRMVQHIKKQEKKSKRR
jgi:GTP-binding protein